MVVFACEVTASNIDNIREIETQYNFIVAEDYKDAMRIADESYGNELLSCKLTWLIDMNLVSIPDKETYEKIIDFIS